MYDRPAGRFEILNPEGSLVRTIPFAWPRDIQFIVSPDQSTVYFEWGTNGDDNQTCELDLATGQVTTLFSSPWSMLTGFAADSETKFFISGSYGEIWQYDIQAGAKSLWEDNNLLSGQFGFDTFRYELSFSNAGRALVRAGYSGAGGDALFLADVCEQDATHHLCNLTVFSNPGDGSGSWDNTAGNSRLDPLGRYAFFRTTTTGAGTQLWRRDLTTSADTLVLLSQETFGLQSVQVFGDDVLFWTDQQIYSCQVDTLACRVVVSSSREEFQIVETRPAPDVTRPTITCDAVDQAWYSTNVSISCKAGDGESGLTNPADAHFTLSTSVASGEETDHASTDSRTVCDVAGNCETAGPFGDIRVDRKAPVVTLTAPAATAYTLGQLVAASYGCADGGSGVATCMGTSPSGSRIDTSTAGFHTFDVTASDQMGHAATQSVTYSVAYDMCLEYDPAQAKPSGSTLPVTVRLCDVNRVNDSSPSVVVSALGIVRVSDQSPGLLEDSGEANPDANFRFADGMYIFNLSLKGYRQGTYAMSVRAAGDPTVHTLLFQVK